MEVLVEYQSPSQYLLGTFLLFDQFYSYTGSYNRIRYMPCAIPYSRILGPPIQWARRVRQWGHGSTRRAYKSVGGTRGHAQLVVNAINQSQLLVGPTISQWVHSQVGLQSSQWARWRVLCAYLSVHVASYVNTPSGKCQLGCVQMVKKFGLQYYSIFCCYLIINVQLRINYRHQIHLV